MADQETGIECEIFIAATPETVFRFLVDPTLMVDWIGLTHTLDPRPGGVFRVEVSKGNVAGGVYTEVIPARRVVFTWGWESAPPGESGRLYQRARQWLRSTSRRRRLARYSVSVTGVCRARALKFIVSAGLAILLGSPQRRPETRAPDQVQPTEAGGRQCTRRPYDKL